jgi:hypothetical protein
MRKVLSLIISLTSFALPVVVVIVVVTSLSLVVVLLSDMPKISAPEYISVGNDWYSLPYNDTNRHIISTPILSLCALQG